MSVLMFLAHAGGTPVAGPSTKKGHANAAEHLGIDAGTPKLGM